MSFFWHGTSFIGLSSRLCSRLYIGTPVRGCRAAKAPSGLVARYAQWTQGTGRQPPRPKRQSVLVRWVYSRTFYYSLAGTGVLASAFYIANLEEVPISGRRRFRIIGPDTERAVAEEQYKQFMKEVGKAVLPPWHPDVLRVKRVMARLISGLKNLEDAGFSDKGHAAAVTSGDAPWTSKDGLDAWEVNVVQAPIMNAVVLPGNKVFVFTEMLKICRDDNDIATILGHEMAHSICHHAAERMSTDSVARGIALGAAGVAIIDLGFTSALLTSLVYAYLAYDYLWDKPASRIQESEADHLGLLLMAASCFDPAASIRFWQLMHQVSGQQRAIPEFMSTHPDDRTRIHDLARWMDSAKTKYANSECGTYTGWKNDFMRTFDSLR